MTFGEMQSITRTKLYEASATFWTDDDIKDAINDAYEEIADATEFYERQATIPLLSGRTYFDLTSILEDDTFLSPRRGWETATSRWYEPTNMRDLDEHTYVQWELTQGAPRMYFLRGNWWLGVWPKANDDVSYKMRFYYTAIPPPFEDDSDEPIFPGEFHMGIVEIALADLLGQERETNSALTHWATGQDYIKQVKEHVDQRQTMARLDVLQ
jgi:hypothetical protein